MFFLNFFNTKFNFSVLTFFLKFQKKNEMLPSSIILTVTLGRSWADHRQIMGRSSADHGQIMGDRLMQKNPENIGFFRYRFFRNFCKFAIFHQESSKVQSYFCRPRQYMEKMKKCKEQEKQSTMSRAREAEQRLATNYYGFDGFPESMFVFFFIGPFSEERLTVF